MFYKLSIKRISASRSSLLILLNSSRDTAPSPPCHMIASFKLRARPSCKNSVCPLTTSCKPIPHNGVAAIQLRLPDLPKGGRLIWDPYRVEDNLNMGV